MKQQDDVFDDHVQEAIDRQLLLFAMPPGPLTAEDRRAYARLSMSFIDSDTDIASLRAKYRIKPGDFTVLLLGKDGGVKLRRHAPVSFAELAGLIDSMPMRQEELRRQAPK